MICLKLLCFLACGGTAFATLTKGEEDVLHDMKLIIKHYLQVSAIPRHEQDMEELYQYAEAFYKYQKTKGNSIRQLLGDIQSNITVDPGRGFRPWDYRYVKHTKNEHGVPKWDLLPDELDDISFDDVRYERHLRWNADLSFLRRTTWLYPLDGNQNLTQYFPVMI